MMFEVNGWVLWLWTSQNEDQNWLKSSLLKGCAVISTSLLVFFMLGTELEKFI